MNKQRLEQMVVMLRNLPEEAPVKFGLATWHCGTTACAVGHACCAPEFIEQGLTLVDGIPTFDDDESWRAVEKFFDLSTSDADHLFYDLNYPDCGRGTTAADVADRIESFLANAEV